MPVLILLLALLNSHIHLNGTFRLPSAAGAAKFVKLDGATRIAVRLNGMRPASLFGGDFNTYVLWFLSADGRATNGGEILLDGDRGRLATSTALNDFSVIVTAEPHYAVAEPSRFIVLRDAQSTEEQIEPRKSITYSYERDTLNGTKEAGGPVHTVVAQAYTAVRLAERAGAGIFAQEELREARRALRQTLELSKQNAPIDRLDAQARQTIQLAIAAQRSAGNRAGSNER